MACWPRPFYLDLWSSRSAWSSWSCFEHPLTFVALSKEAAIEEAVYFSKSPSFTFIPHNKPSYVLAHKFLFPEQTIEHWAYRWEISMAIVNRTACCWYLLLTYTSHDWALPEWCPLLTYTSHDWALPVWCPRNYQLVILCSIEFLSSHFGRSATKSFSKRHTLYLIVT